MMIKGYCPAQDKQYTIDVTYLDASTLEKREFIKGQFYCDYNVFGDKCNGNNCPIYKNAPERK